MYFFFALTDPSWGECSVIMKTDCETDGSFYSTNRGATPRQLGPRYLVVHEYKCSITGGWIISILCCTNCIIVIIIFTQPTQQFCT